MKKLWNWLRRLWLSITVAHLANRCADLRASACEIRRELEAVEQQHAEQSVLLSAWIADTYPGSKQDLSSRLEYAEATADEFQASLHELEECVRRELWGKAKAIVAEWDAQADALANEEAV